MNAEKLLLLHNGVGEGGREKNRSERFCVRIVNCGYSIMLFVSFSLIMSKCYQSTDLN